MHINTKNALAVYVRAASPEKERAKLRLVKNLAIMGAKKWRNQSPIYQHDLFLRK